MKLGLYWAQLSIVILLACIFKICECIEADFTVVVKAAGRECFYQHVNEGVNIELEYQVVEGGDLDINFVLSSPSGKVILTEIRRTDGIHRHESTETGEYTLCLDNTFSRFSQKLVFFELITDEESEDELQSWDELTGAEELMEVKLEVFKEKMDILKKNLQKTEQLQNIFKIYEAQDRSIMEDNFMRVNTWSGINLAVMITVGVIQVLMIRNLFEDKSKVSQVLKMKT
ncbi:unnamed protein product [Owenia fusiformis]|uniref:Uncharacterized protein n=1 Tax=Owenia fusiformis TaxID=6347 RepID=A0A8J1UBV9_OWEFU|nr:unnamed protein product [Owenia fusiformis]